MQCLTVTEMHRFWCAKPLEKTDWWQQQSEEVEEVTEMGEEETNRGKSKVGVRDGKAEEKEMEAGVI